MKHVTISRKHQIVAVPFSPEIRNLFPDARDVTLHGAAHLALPHQPIETFLLRKHGYDVPSPILHHYDWPGSLRPFDVQRQTCALLTMAPRGYCLNGMGTGKTRSALWSWDYLRSKGLAGKLLVVAPLSTLTFVWAREVFNTLPHATCAVLYGAKKRRLDRLAEDADIYIINHDGLRTIRDELDARTDIDALVLDELAVYRNGSSARTKQMRKYAANMKWVWGMTGSPIPTSPTDAWAQATIVTPDSVPKYFGRFRDELMLKVSTFKYVPKVDAVERAFAVLQPAVRYTLDDILELPPTIERFVDVKLGPKQAKVYKEIATKCYSALQNDEITAANAGAVMMKLLQVSTGWVYTREGKIASLDNGARIDALIDAINSTDRKVLVFSPFKHSLVGISAALDKEGIEHAVVSGDTPAVKRSEIFTLFQNTDKYKVLNAHPQCLAHGVTLTAADTVIWFAPVTSLETYDQANHRIRRVGQGHKQLILHLQSTPVERRIYGLLQGKQSIQLRLLELFETATQITSGGN